MLRRRIFSAAMASVMALSSVAVVAQAAETTNQVKTKADLEELVTKTYGDSWRADELCNYGSVSQQNMLNALEAADVILADADSDTDDYTVAYTMVVAVANKLVQHSAEELKALIDECQPIIDTNNIYNEELQDLIYDPDTFGTLEEALDYAKALVVSTSKEDITEAYEVLAAAKSALSKNAVVSKAMFRSVLKQYQDIIDSQYSYDSWRRGSIAWTELSDGGFWTQYSNGVSNVAYGHFWNLFISSYEKVNEAYDMIDDIKGLNKTTDTTIYAGYVMAQDAIALYKSWSADDVTKATKSGLVSLIKEYHGQLVYDYATSSFEALVDALNAAGDITDVNGGEVTADTIWNTEYAEASTWGWGKYNRLVTAEAVIKSGATLYVPVDENGYWTGDAIETTKQDNVKYQTISKNTKFEISKLIDITGLVDDSADLSAADNNTADSSDEIGYPWGKLAGLLDEVTEQDMEWDLSVSLGYAMNMAEAYIAGDYDASGIEDLDWTGVVSLENGPTGSAKEFQLVYRYLYYALTEKYSGTVASNSTYTRADVIALIEDAWELIEKTGDASIFNETNTDLVDCRASAKSWVSLTKTNKLYKDHEGSDVYGYESSDEEYAILKECYNDLLDEYNALKYSFGDIYDAIAETADAIDDGDLEATDALLAALNDCAYYLSLVDDVTYDKDGNEYMDNAAFNSDREFMPNNRLVTCEDETYVADIGGKIYVDADGGNKGNYTHANLLAAFNALNDAIAAQAEAEVVLGDANGDGKLNTADAAAIAKYVVGLGTVDEKAADYNKDGKVNVADAAAIIKAIVGLN